MEPADTEMRPSGMSIMKELEALAIDNPEKEFHGRFEGNLISVMVFEDGFNYRWNEEVVTQGKLMEYLRHE